MSKVLVAMSGGVDSSVAAYLLKQQGHEVAGVTFKLFCYGSNDSSPKSCCGLEGVRDAQSVARKLGIQHVVLDMQEIFTEKVYNNFISEYEKGRTPIPCVECNTHVKFAPLLAWALRNGYEFVATGHYCKMVSVNGNIFLSQAKYIQKDQSYFLWGLKKEILPKIMFPLGDLTKDEVRVIAKEANLPNWDKLESQDICFVDGRKYTDVLKEEIPDSRIFKLGDIFYKGKRIGFHTGTGYFTIGQRIPRTHISRDFVWTDIYSNNLYVQSIDSNTGVIVANEKSEIYSKKLELINVNLFCHPSWLIGGVTLQAKIRYKAELAKCYFYYDEKLNKYWVEFFDPQLAITPGQSCVLYSSNDIECRPQDRVLLGGIIDNTNVDFIV